MREGEDAEGNVLQPQHSGAVDGRVRQAAVVLGEDVHADSTAVDAPQHQGQIPEPLDSLRDAHALVEQSCSVRVAVGQEQPGHQRKCE